MHINEQNIDTLVLGCTHYPLLSKTIQQVMGEEVTLVDSAMAVAEYLSRYLSDENDGQKGRDSFYVSDNENKFAEIAERILQHNIGNLTRVRLYESWFKD